MLDILHDADLQERPSYSYAYPGTALVKCGNGHISSLSQHKITGDGTVTPSLDCPTELCGWHEHVRLLDWPPPRPVKPERPGVGGLV